MKLCITKSYGERTVFDNYTLQIPDGKITCVLGNSGVGKTTLLKCISGLTTFKGEVERKDDALGYVFQEPRLIPHLTVEENLIYIGAAQEDIDGVLRALEISDLAKKRACTLSGGEKQRVALARAIVKKPSVLLLDEPFSSLDLPLKLRLLETFRALHKQYAPTVVFVTHDIDEALCVADNIVVMKDGKTAYEKCVTPQAYGENADIKKQIIKAIL